MTGVRRVLFRSGLFSFFVFLFFSMATGVPVVHTSLLSRRLREWQRPFWPRTRCPPGYLLSRRHSPSLFSFFFFLLCICIVFLSYLTNESQQNLIAWSSHRHRRMAWGKFNVGRYFFFLWRGDTVPDRKSVVVGKEGRSRWSPYH